MRRDENRHDEENVHMYKVAQDKAKWEGNIKIRQTRKTEIR